MMSARDERIRAFGVSRGARPFVFLIFPLRDKRLPSADREPIYGRARFFLGLCWCVVCVGGLSAQGLGHGLGWLAERVLSVGLFGFPNTLGACAYLTLGLIHETILLSDQANVLIDRKLDIMSESKAPEGKAIPSLVKAYALLVSSGDQGVREWFRKAQKVSVRDFEATIVEAKKFGEVRGITKNSSKFVKVIVASFDLEGADKVSVIEIAKVAEIAQRALKVDGALALASMSKDFEEFQTSAELARDKKAEGKPARNNTGAGRKAGEVTVTLNADGLIAQALEGLRDLVDVTITDFDKASDLIKLVNHLVTTSLHNQALNESVERHPAKGLITPVKGGAVLDVEELGKRVKASA